MGFDVLTFVLLVVNLGAQTVREWRSGFGRAQEKLIDLLQDTSNAQARRIEQLEEELKASREETAVLRAEVAELRRTVADQAVELMRMRE
jgi:hypothetical protein